MAIQVKEKTIEEIESKLSKMTTNLNKIAYLESAIKSSGSDFEVKRFILENLAKLYEQQKMYEKAAKAYSNKASIEIMTKNKIDSYINSAELYSKLGKLEEADDMFLKALRECPDITQKSRVKLARKNIYMQLAKDFESKGKIASSVKYYEKLYKMNLDDAEKSIIREKLKKSYTALGMFREARLI